MASTVEVDFRSFRLRRNIGVALGKLFASILALVGVTMLGGIFAFRRFKRRDHS